MKRLRTHAGAAFVSMRLTEEEKIQLLRLSHATEQSMSELLRVPLATVMSEVMQGTIVRRVRHELGPSRVNIRIRPTEKQQLVRLACETNWSVSDLLQETLTRVLSHLSHNS